MDTYKHFLDMTLDMLSHQSPSQFPVPSSVSDSILGAAIYFSAVLSSPYTETEQNPNIASFAREVIGFLTRSFSSLFLYNDQVYSIGADGKRYFMEIRSVDNTPKARIWMPKSPEIQNLQGLDAMLFEAGVIIGTFVFTLSNPVSRLFHSDTISFLSSFAKQFADNCSILRKGYKESLKLLYRMLYESVPWTVAQEPESQTTLLAILENPNFSEYSDVHLQIAYRHLFQSSLVAMFYTVALPEYIEQNEPLPDHDALVGKLSSARWDLVVEPARSMLYELVSYSFARRAKKLQASQESPHAAFPLWIEGAQSALQALLSSFVPRHAKYIANCIAQASFKDVSIYRKKCADAIFSGTYVMGHLWSLSYAPADKIVARTYIDELRAQSNDRPVRLTGSKTNVALWEEIPPYRDNPMYVQQFLSTRLQNSVDNLTTNMLAGVILIEQFLRELPSKRHKLENPTQFHLLTVHPIQSSDNRIDLYEDRTLLLVEPFLWAFQILMSIYSQGSEGDTRLRGVGYTYTEPLNVVSVHDLLLSATRLTPRRASFTYAEALPELELFLKSLVARCPEGTEERAYLTSLISELGIIYFG